MSEVSPEIIAKTQKSLGKYVKKPALSEKLLKKPPFRFLHDVIKAVIKETGFLKGLFTEDELNSENVKEKEAKVAFLAKLIDAVKIVSKSDLKVRPSKIVAGLEPVETNILLQTIGKLIDKKVDTVEYVAKIKSGEKVLPKETKTSKKGEKDKEKKENKVRDKSVSRVKKSESLETPKTTDRGKDSSRTRPKEKKSSKENKNGKEQGSRDKGSNKTSSRKAEPETPKKNEEICDGNVAQSEQKKDIVEESGNTINEPTQPNKQTDIIEPEKTVDEVAETPQPPLSNARQTSAGLIRPKSARPKSGDRNRVPQDPIEINPSVSQPQVRPPSSLLRPPSVRPSSARPGAPRLRPESAMRVNEPTTMGNINVIVENFDSGLGDEDETVVIQTTPETDHEDPISTNDLLSISGENKGQLVEQILEQIQENQGDTKRKVEIDWEQEGLRGKDATTKEVTQLRALIQGVTKTANPLGKLMSYLHEDMDAMYNELQMWTNTKKQLYAEIDKQKKLSIESSKPLLDKLNQLRQEVKKQEQEILTTRSNILKNEQRIAELMGSKL